MRKLLAAGPFEGGRATVYWRLSVRARIRTACGIEQLGLGLSDAGEADRAQEATLGAAC
ncbi:hypothetical protein ABZX95_43895 [Streptomyces sp. NPDC004232]|uniref:hypothetical protein n=1 Tax=Streptomyces sp. NPDC004232 TaxID=3154454 RepID=UPI001DA9DFE2|nr:hypothetical protein [Streptomyces sp. tea 10]